MSQAPPCDGHRHGRGMGPDQIWAGHYIRALISLVSVRPRWVHGAQRAKELVVVLVRPLAVVANHVENGRTGVFLAQVNAQYVSQHLHAVQHDGRVVDEVDEVEGASALHPSELLLVEIGNAIPNPVNARTYAVPSRDAPILLLLKGLFYKGNLLRDMLVSVQRIVEPLDEVGVEMYPERLFAAHRYTSISPAISLGSNRSRASRAAFVSC